MPVNKRLILLTILALALASLINQVINLAQVGIYSSSQLSEAERSLTAATVVPKVITAETVVEDSKLERIPEGAYGREQPLEQKELSLLLDIAFSLVMAAGALFLVKRTKLK